MKTQINFFKTGYKKRGIFFSTDALIAVTIIVFALIIALPIARLSYHQNYQKSDLINVLASTSMQDLKNDPQVNNIIQESHISDFNKSVLRQIAEFYVTNLTLAKNLSRIVLSKFKTNENIGIWANNELLAVSNFTPISDKTKQLTIQSEYVSGLSNQSNNLLSGFSSKAFLSNNYSTEYIYFGGYVGEGNITQRFFIPGEITRVQAEFAINNNFEFYINGYFSGYYLNSSSDFIPSTYVIPANYINYFNQGENTIEIKGPNNTRIQGGFLRITYIANLSLYSQIDRKKYFPGINGTINLYNGFTVPSRLNNMQIFLHLNATNEEIILKIKNISIFEQLVNGELTQTFSNAYLSSLIDYNSIENKTIPLRIGINSTAGAGGTVHLVDVSDLSLSMQCSVSTGDCWVSQSNCESCGGIWMGPINSAKTAANTLIDEMLNYPNNKVGLVGYAEYTYSQHTLLPVTNDKIALKNIANGWSTHSSTCICCGLKSAMDSLATSPPEAHKFIILMSDGTPNQACVSNAIQDAKDYAQEAHNNYGITIYTVGLGSSVDIQTMQDIAALGGGQYYYADVSTIVDIFRQISQSIIETYSSQTLTSDKNSILYPDSYIQLNYDPTPLPYGFIINLEKQFDNADSVTFSIPQDSSIVDAKVISYSGPLWTYNVTLNNKVLYNLSNFSSDFAKLGDPFVFLIPSNEISGTSPNVLSISLADSPTNFSSGSLSNKLIYRIRKNMTGYSECAKTIEESICQKAEGCFWHIIFDDGSYLNFPAPKDYIGTKNCYYMPSPSPSVYDNTDAIDTSVYSLLKSSDIDSNGKINTKFNEDNLVIDSFEIQNIPFIWSSEIQVRTWY